MAEHSKIEWTDATWNPITGCQIVSPGCTNCYAMKLAGTRLQHHPSRKGLTQDSKAGPVWTGEVRFNEVWLDQPLRWKRPRMIFVCAHGDLFADGVKDEWIDQIFAVMALSPQHIFQVLTKRPERMREYMARAAAGTVGAVETMFIEGTAPHGWPNALRGNPRRKEGDPIAMWRTWPLPNVWLGVSVEDQTRADERIPILLSTPAAVRWISAEPLLGPIDLTAIPFGYPIGNAPSYQDAITGRIWMPKGSPTWAIADRQTEGERTFVDLCAKLDWVVVGGESGAGARPMHPDWARSLRDQCASAGVAFHFKQWGEWSPVHLLFDGDDSGSGAAYAMPGCCDVAAAHTRDQECRFWQDNQWVHWPHVRASEAIGARHIGKAAAGRTLDGRLHDDFPQVVRVS